LSQYGITSYSRAFLAVTCPSQIKFKSVQLLARGGSNIMDNDPRSRRARVVLVCCRDGANKKWIKRSVYIVSYGIAVVLLKYGLHFIINSVEEWPVLEAEGIVMLLSCMVHIWNIPPNMYQLFMNLARVMMMTMRRNNHSSPSYSNETSTAMTATSIQVIYPYGSLYWSISSREFWRKWSRPSSSIIRHMFYYPLGGQKRAWVSIPIMFWLNASSHYSVSEVLVGDRAEMEWNLVFFALGLAATLEVLGDNYFNIATQEIPLVVASSNEEETSSQREERVGHTSSRGTREGDVQIVIPQWWKGIRFLMASISFRFAAYVLLHNCFHSSLTVLLGGWK